jgi:hypothetical protein
VGLAELPATVEGCLAGVDPDAAVYQVGAERPNRVVLVGQDLAEVLLRVNGAVTIADGGPVAEGPVTASRKRRPTKAIRLSPEQWERLQMLRKEAGMSWDQLADWMAELCGA